MKFRLIPMPIKILSYSIFDSEEMLRKLEKVWNEMDAVDNKCSEMLLKLAQIYTAMTRDYIISR